MTDPFRNVLVQRNGVAEAATARMRRGGEEAIVCRMAAVHVRMRHAAENGKIIPMLFKNFEIGRESIIPSGLLRKKLIGQQTKIVTDGKHPARRSAGCGARRTGAGRGKG